MHTWVPGLDIGRVAVSLIYIPLSYTLILSSYILLSPSFRLSSVDRIAPINIPGTIFSANMASYLSVSGIHRLTVEPVGGRYGRLLESALLCVDRYDSIPRRHRRIVPVLVTQL